MEYNDSRKFRLIVVILAIAIAAAYSGCLDGEDPGSQADPAAPGASVTSGTGATSDPEQPLPDSQTPAPPIHPPNADAVAEPSGMGQVLRPPKDGAEMPAAPDFYIHRPHPSITPV